MRRAISLIAAFVAVHALSVPAVATAGIAAEYVTITTRPLAGGDSIKRETAGKCAQDDLGRVRLEVDSMVFTMDPVAGSRWTADLRSGIVHRQAVGDGRQEEVVERVNELNSQFEQDMPDPPDWIPRNRQGTVSDLGMRVINGVNSVGKRVVQTIAAGTLGNEKSITVEFETWTSHDFGFPLSVRTVIRDPVNGVQIRELRNIVRQDGNAIEEAFRIDPYSTVKEQEIPGASLSRMVHLR